MPSRLILEYSIDESIIHNRTSAIHIHFGDKKWSRIKKRVFKVENTHVFKALFHELFYFIDRNSFSEFSCVPGFMYQGLIIELRWMQCSPGHSNLGKFDTQTISQKIKTRFLNHLCMRVAVPSLLYWRIISDFRAFVNSSSGSAII